MVGQRWYFNPSDEDRTSDAERIIQHKYKIITKAKVQKAFLLRPLD